jgi:threonylcarbamoyladenosine tRNA methylthiotransferase MtaB
MKSLTTNRTAVAQVLGCKVNQAEAASLAGILEQNGYRIDSTAVAPDLAIVHTCCVTMKAEGKSRRMVSRLLAKYPSAKIVVSGCLAVINPSSLKGLSERVVVLGAFEKDRLSEFLKADGKPMPEVAPESSSFRRSFIDPGPSRLPGRSRAFLKVQDGCSSRCSYCIVPTARGPSRSLPCESVMENVRNLYEQGSAEIVLTGVHLGHYGRDLKPRLCLEDLLDRLLDESPGPRFRLSSVEPNEISSRLIAMVSRNQRLCKHFHIPLQSGDYEILDRMGRPYNASVIRGLVEQIRDQVPDACVGVDVMVGFPGEDDSSFLKTKSLIEDLNPAYLHVFPFSSRPGTAAAGFEPRLPERIKAERVNELRALSAKLRLNFYERFLGRALRVAPESQSADGWTTVRTDNYIPVRARLSSHFRDRVEFDVIIEKVEPGRVLGRATDPTEL